MCKKKKKQKRRSHQQQLWRLFWTLTLKNAIKCFHWCSHYCYTFCPTPSNQLTPSALLHIFPRIGECLLQHRTRQTSQTVCASCGRELIRHRHTHTHSKLETNCHHNFISLATVSKPRKKCCCCCYWCLFHYQDRLELWWLCQLWWRWQPEHKVAHKVLLGIMWKCEV